MNLLFLWFAALLSSSICDTHNGRAFKAILRKDKGAYGDSEASAQSAVEAEVGSDLQVMVDEHIETSA